MSAAPATIILSGTVHHNKSPFAGVGDVGIVPGANYTDFIDGYVHDGKQWRALDLESLGVVNRRFSTRDEIGSLMRQIGAIIRGHQGDPVHYEKPSSGRSKYVFRGIPFSRIQQVSAFPVFKVRE